MTVITDRNIDLLIKHSLIQRCITVSLKPSNNYLIINHQRRRRINREQFVISDFLLRFLEKQKRNHCS